MFVDECKKGGIYRISSDSRYSKGLWATILEHPASEENIVRYSETLNKALSREYMGYDFISTNKRGTQYEITVDPCNYCSLEPDNNSKTSDLWTL